MAGEEAWSGQAWQEFLGASFQAMARIRPKKGKVRVWVSDGSLPLFAVGKPRRSEEHTSELQSQR